MSGSRLGKMYIAIASESETLSIAKIASWVYAPVPEKRKATKMPIVVRAPAKSGRTILLTSCHLLPDVLPHNS